MNSVNLIGRLTRDPEIRHSQNNIPVCSFTLAVDRRLSREKKQELQAQGKATADFIRISVWGKQAEFAKTYLRKGLKVAIQGRINTYSIQDETGNRRYFTEVVATNIEFVEKAQNSYSPQDSGVINEMSNDFDDSDFPVIDDLSNMPF